MAKFNYSTEIDGIYEEIIFEGGKDHSAFIHYRNDIMARIALAKNYKEFNTTVEQILKVNLHDKRYSKFRLAYIQERKKEFLERNEQKKGFKPFEPKVIKSSMEEILNQLKEYPKNTAIVTKLSELVRDDYFDRGSIKEKGFFTFFSIELLGTDKKTSLYNTYNELVNGGVISKLLKTTPRA